MKLVDTHCHVHFDAFDEDREAVITRARSAGIEIMINVGTDPENNRKAHELALAHSCMRATAGLHPHSSHQCSDSQLREIEDFVRKTKPAAIGEIGLDYFKSEADPAVQKKVFIRMLHIARAAGLPVIVHSREAFADTIDLLKQEAQGMRGVMHCFSYDKQSLAKLLDIGFLASFTANITYKSASQLLEVAAYAPLDRIMLETDSPYLAPQRHRGKRNEPAYLTQTAEWLAQKRALTVETVSETTTRTAREFFSI